MSRPPRAATAWLLSIVIMSAGVRLVATQKPDFSGRWELQNPEGGAADAQATAISQVVRHREPFLDVTRTIRTGAATETLTLRLSTDGRLRVNRVDGNDLVFETRWRGRRLVTEVRQGQGPPLEEEWSLSSDRQRLTIALGVKGDKAPAKLQVYTRAGDQP